jgi:UDP-glucose 4-epimerase
VNGLSVWITGARGFIGRHLARTLADKGHRVCGLGHGLWSEPEARGVGVVQWLNGDVRTANLQSLARQQPGPPDAVFHLAGGSSVAAAIAAPLEDFDRTVRSTAELLEWLRQESATTRLIVVSSAAVYGSVQQGLLSEESACRPCSPYGFHKLVAEHLCASYAGSYGVRATAARLFSVYGHGLKKQLLWDLCMRLSAGGNVELSGTGEELRDWTDVRDVARALALLLESSLDCVSRINIGTGIGTSVKRIAELVCGAWPNATPVNFNGRSRPGDPFSLVADAQRLSQLGFDWRISVEQGVVDYVRWFRRQAPPVFGPRRGD